MKIFYVILLFMIMLACQPVVNHPAPSVDFSHGDLQVSPDGHFLVHADGTPFFYLGDTCWELFHRMTREEAEKYLENRRARRFTVIQAVALSELNGLKTSNAYGDLPLVGLDPTKPDVTEGSRANDFIAYDYWDHVDWIIDKAAEKGLYIGLLPTWGDKVLKRWGNSPVIFDSLNAAVYGNWISERYQDKPNIIWILGGDRAPEFDGVDYKPIWRAMAKAIKDVDSRHLMTYHTWGKTSTSQWFQNDEWLDFNMLQSGHYQHDYPNWQQITHDYHLEPAKPCFDGEPNYEDIPVAGNPDNGWFNAWDARKAAYRSLFAGAFGHTYGCNDIWQLWLPGRTSSMHPRTPWPVAMQLPGAYQMTHVRALMESRPMLERVPDQSLIVSDNPVNAGHIRATRARNGSYAMIYLPRGGKITVDLGKLTGNCVIAWWFNPVNGTVVRIGEFTDKTETEFKTSFNGPENDRVLVLDDAEKNYPAPGKSL